MENAAGHEAGLSLKQLAQEEERLLAIVKTVRNLPEPDLRLNALDVFASYRQVHAAYADMLANPLNGAEALKRALFLQWTAALEPPFLTGIVSPLGSAFAEPDFLAEMVRIDRLLERKVLEELESVLANQRLDHEGTLMLGWYDSVWEFYFDPFPGLPHLARARVVKNPDIHLAAAMSEESLRGRGQMGEYFSEMLRGRARRGAP